MSDRLDLLLGVADPTGNDGTAERMRAGFENEAARREVIGKAIVDDIAWAKAGGKKCARRIPKIPAMAFRLEDRPRRDQQTLEPARRGHGKSAEGRPRGLALL